MSKADILNGKHSRTWETLKRLEALPLEQKIALSQRRVMQYKEAIGNVYVSFSGGKDSTVLLDLVRKIIPDAPAVFADTGLEWPEIRDFVKTIDNVEWVKPKMTFPQVIKNYGYPVISKEVCEKVYQVKTAHSQKTINTRLYGDSKGNGKLPLTWQKLITAPFDVSSKCCDVMKKRPMKKYEAQTGQHPIVGTMASESRLRQTQWMRSGCNSFTGRAMSAPLSFWTEKDIWEYIHKYNIRYSKIYDMGYKRTGCMFCMFGIQFDGEDGYKRFKLMKVTHPKQYNYIMNKLGGAEILKYLDIGKQGELFNDGVE